MIRYGIVCHELRKKTTQWHGVNCQAKIPSGSINIVIYEAQFMFAGLQTSEKLGASRDVQALVDTREIVVSVQGWFEMLYGFPTSPYSWRALRGSESCGGLQKPPY